MLDAKTLQWLEIRKNLCTHCGKRKWCRAGNKHKYNTAKCRFWDIFAWHLPSHTCVEDYEDAAEFEARVQKALMYQYEKAYQCKDVSGGFLPKRETMLMYARLAAEREMIAEGKGPGRRVEE